MPIEGQNEIGTRAKIVVAEASVSMRHYVSVRLFGWYHFLSILVSLNFFFPKIFCLLFLFLKMPQESLQGLRGRRHLRACAQKVASVYADGFLFYQFLFPSIFFFLKFFPNFFVPENAIGAAARIAMAEASVSMVVVGGFRLC